MLTRFLASSFLLIGLGSCINETLSPNIDSPIIHFELIQESTVIGEQTVISVRIIVESGQYQTISVEHNGVELEGLDGDCNNRVIKSLDFKPTDDVTAHLRIGEIYRDTYCLILK